MPTRFSSRYAKRPAAKRPAAPARLMPAPLPSAVVDAVLRFSDLQRDMGGGKTLMRMSPTRLRDDEVRTFLGDDAPRACCVSILWNEREGEIIRVFEDRPLNAQLAA